MKTKLTIISLLLVFLSLSFSSNAQEAIIPRPSPLAVISMKYKDAYVKITYSQPHKKERKIFGGIVPFGQIWRTGANEATEITTTKDIIIQDSILHAGTYSIFTIPTLNSWTIIFNKELGQWGAYNYNPNADVFRIDVPVKPVKKGVIWEPFTMEFKQNNEAAELTMMWDKTKVSIPIKFEESH